MLVSTTCIAGALRNDLFPTGEAAHSQSMMGCIVATMVVVVVNLKVCTKRSSSLSAIALINLLFRVYFLTSNISPKSIDYVTDSINSVDL